MFQLRPYQREAVNATVAHFRQSDNPAVIVLPTGAGKSLVIAELARIARQRILVLAHVKELVEQNCAKYRSYGLAADIFAAGLNSKQAASQVVFGSVQSVAKNLDAFADEFSLLIIDECHRVGLDKNSEYQQIIAAIKRHNPRLKVLGLTATPYRLESGWIYQRHRQLNCQRTLEPTVFSECIYELPLKYMIDNGYLTPARVIDAPVALYDFEQLRHKYAGSQSLFSDSDLNQSLTKSKRASARICAQIIELAQERQGVMIFAATVAHAKELVGYLPSDCSALITGAMNTRARDSVITAFKQKQIKFLVNVSVLTTGFDAPHVDMIAILRPTESVSLYQQIVGRGLRLSEGKQDCLVLDYAGNNYDLFRPEVGTPKPDSRAEIVNVPCPACGHCNQFWGLTDSNGDLIEHYGRRCQGLIETQSHRSSAAPERQQCDYRFRFKECGQCGAENDIAARNCQSCAAVLVDPDDKLREALKLSDVKVLRCSGISFESAVGKNGGDRIKITYHDEDGAELSESFGLTTAAQRAAFELGFARYHKKDRADGFKPSNSIELIANQQRYRAPDFIIARERKIGSRQKAWQITDKLFDYQGRYRRANELH